MQRGCEAFIGDAEDAITEALLEQTDSDTAAVLARRE